MKFSAPAALLFLASLAVATEAPVARGEVDAPVAVKVKQDVPVKREEDFTLEKRKGGKKGGGGGGDEDAASTHAISFAALAAAVGAAAIAA